MKRPLRREQLPRLIKLNMATVCGATLPTWGMQEARLSLGHCKAWTAEAAIGTCKVYAFSSAAASIQHSCQEAVATPGSHHSSRNLA